jgi:hypothetical protein
MKKLTVIVDDRTHKIEVPDDILHDGEEFFRKMDRDMDAGWRMGPEFIENPTQVNRCQIAANKLLVSLSTTNETLAKLMAGYIVKRLRGVSGVRIDTGGEMLNTEFIYDNSADEQIAERAARSAGKLDAMQQAAQDISQVYKVGKGYRYASYDHRAGQWVESPILPDEQEAQRLRMQAYQERLSELTRANE